MTHAQLVQAALAWLRRGVLITHEGGDFVHRARCRPVFSEIVTASNETPDVIGWHYGRSFVVECKASRGDFFADRKKPHMQHPTSGMGRRRFYLTPSGLVTADEVPEWCGLAYVRGASVDVVKQAPERDVDATAAMRECVVLASAIRRHALGVAFDEKRGRFETIAERDARTA